MSIAGIPEETGSMPLRNSGTKSDSKDPKKEKEEENIMTVMSEQILSDVGKSLIIPAVRD